MLRARDACLTSYMEGPREFSTDFERAAGSFIQVSPVLRLTRQWSNSSLRKIVLQTLPISFHKQISHRFKAGTPICCRPETFYSTRLLSQVFSWTEALESCSQIPTPHRMFLDASSNILTFKSPISQYPQRSGIRIGCFWSTLACGTRFEPTSTETTVGESPRAA